MTLFDSAYSGILEKDKSKNYTLTDLSGTGAMSFLAP
jgi:hypothetical protein